MSKVFHCDCCGAQITSAETGEWFVGAGNCTDCGDDLCGKCAGGFDDYGNCQKCRDKDKKPVVPVNNMVDDGGRVFPYMAWSNTNCGYTEPMPGMTLRQLYKAAAIASGTYPSDPVHYKDMANWAGYIADAMIEEDKKEVKF